MNESSRDLLVRGIAAAKSKDNKEARFYLEWFLRQEPPIDQCIEAWYWLNEVSENLIEQRSFLEEILAHNPYEARARRKLAILDGRVKSEEIIDPDRITNAIPKDPQQVDSKRFICPTCGGRLTYTPDGQSLVCEYCESRQKTSGSATNSLQENDFIVAMATASGHSRPTATHTLVCQGCSAIFILPPEQISLTCPYCDSTHVIQQRETKEWHIPDAIIPFQINEQKARIALHSWFQAKDFDNLPTVAPGKGVYLPVWSFDLGGSIDWKCYFYDQRNKRWITESGEKPILIGNVLVPATNRLTELLHLAIQQYNLVQLVPYDSAYLANWPAESYQIPIGDAALEARKTTLDRQREEIAGGFDHEVRDLVVKSAHMTVDTYKLLLLPTWLTCYKIEDKTYQVLINGQTGEVTAEHPKRGIQAWLDKLLLGW